MSRFTAASLDKVMSGDASLVYVYEDPPGFRRRKHGKGFCYLDMDGKVIKSAREKSRLKAIAVPPTYNDVWYCPLHNGHLQATGRDASSKKQYFYHANWEELRDANKFSLMLEFAEKLPSLRRKISALLNENSLSKNTVLAAMVRILDQTGIRVGNKSASETHETYGLTTLTKEHLEESEHEFWLEYDGKGNVHQQKMISDSKVVDLIKECVEIPGQYLFQYESDDGGQPISSSDLNAFIKELTDERFSAKDFRTWRFSCFFLEEVIYQSEPSTQSKGESTSLKSVLEAVAEETGNTPAILKNSYIHPVLLEIVKNKQWSKINDRPEAKAGLRKSERQLIDLSDGA